MRVWSNIYLMAVCAASLVFSLPVGGVHQQNLTGTVGGNIPMQPRIDDLRDINNVVWVKIMGDTKQTLYEWENGQIDHEPPKELAEKLHLNPETHSLTVRNLGVSDRGVYVAYITDGDNTVHPYNFTLTVPDPVSDQMTAGPSRNSTTDPPKDQENHTAAIIAGSVTGVVVLLVVVVVVVYLIRTKKKEGSGRPDPEIQREISDDHPTQQLMDK